MFLAYVMEVFGSKLGWDTECSKVFPGIPQRFQETLKNTILKYAKMDSLIFKIYFLLISSRFDGTESSKN